MQSLQLARLEELLLTIVDRAAFPRIEAGHIQEYLKRSVIELSNEANTSSAVLVSQWIRKQAGIIVNEFPWQE